MPRQAKGIRLYQHQARGIWYIRDGGRTLSTRTRDRGEAEKALSRYVIERDRPAAAGIDGPRAPDALTIAEALDAYASEHAPTVRDPARIGHAIAALLPFFGGLPVATITGEVCRRYGRHRDRAPATVRKELGVLQAAVNYCHAEGYLTIAPRVRLPEKPPARDRWLTRDEAAALLRAARRNPQDRARHLCRFILVALYTGTRSDAILRLRFMPNTAGGWVDTDRGILHRRAEGSSESKKRQPPIPLPRPLLAHLRRWERNGARWVVEFDGQRVGSIRTAWRKTIAAAGIDYCRPHDLRHTAITWAMQGGMDRWQATGYFGVSTEVLEGVYAHHHPDYLREAAAVMGRVSVRAQIQGENGTGGSVASR